MKIPEEAYSLSGLAFLQAILNGDLPSPAMAKTMSMQLDYVEHGFARFLARATEQHLNPMMGVHGGFSATVLDSVTGCAVHTALPAGKGYGTVDLSVKLIRPIPLNTEMVAEGRLINLSRNLGVSEGDIRDASGKIFAHATCTCSLFDLPPAT